MTNDSDRQRWCTIGVYGFDQDTFLRRLHDAGVHLLVDVRQRRGVRGPEYSWANSLRLQSALSNSGIEYAHHRELAPTTELRHLQYAEDDRQGVGKRTRRELGVHYICRYTKEILNRADLARLLESVDCGQAAALLCVETYPQACHRSLIAERLAERHHVHVEHLLP